jgi:hypothetical protein
MIFLLFSTKFTRFSIFTLDLDETDLRTGPRISQIGPQNANLDCNWVPGAMAGGGSSIPAKGRLGSAEKGRGSGVGSPRVPFRGLVVAEEQPAAVLGDADGRWPQGASAPACWPAILHNRQLGRLQRGCGEVEEGSAARFAIGKWSSARGLQWRPVADNTSVWQQCARARRTLPCLNRRRGRPGLSRRRGVPRLQCRGTAASAGARDRRTPTDRRVKRRRGSGGKCGSSTWRGGASRGVRCTDRGSRACLAASRTYNGVRCGARGGRALERGNDVTVRHTSAHCGLP